MITLYYHEVSIKRVPIIGIYFLKMHPEGEAAPHRSTAHYFFFCTVHIISFFILISSKYSEKSKNLVVFLDKSIYYFCKMDNELKKIGKLLNEEKENARIAQEKFDLGNENCFHCHMKTTNLGCWILNVIK